MRRYLMLFSALARVTSQQPQPSYDNNNNLKSLDCGDMIPVCCAALQGDAAKFTVLKEFGVDVNAPCRILGHDKTPVFIAAEYGHAEAITALSNAGANVNTPWSHMDETPLYIAVRNGDEKAVKALLDAGADASLGISRIKRDGMIREYEPFGIFSVMWDFIVDSEAEGNTPLKLAKLKQSKSPNHQAIARLLEEHFLKYPNGVKPVGPISDTANLKRYRSHKLGSL